MNDEFIIDRVPEATEARLEVRDQGVTGSFSSGAPVFSMSSHSRPSVCVCVCVS